MPNGRPDVLRMPQPEYEAWLVDAGVSLGGTDVGALLGVNPYKSAAEVWDDCLGLRPVSLHLSAPVRRGMALEAVISQEYVRETGRAVAPVVASPHNAYGWQFRQRPAGAAIIHPQMPYSHATPDGLTTGGPDAQGDTGVLELKSLGERTYRETVERGGPAPAYYAQVQWQMACSGLTWGAFAALNAERWELFTIDVARDADFIRSAEAAVRTFWGAHILPRRRPVAGEPYPSPVPVQIPPPAGGVPRRTDPEWRAAAAEYIQAAAEGKLAEHRLRLAKERVQALIGGASGGDGHGLKVYWKEATGRRLDEHAVIEGVYDRDAVRRAVAEAMASFDLLGDPERMLMARIDAEARLSDLGAFKRAQVTRPFKAYIQGVPDDGREP